MQENNYIIRINDYIRITVFLRTDGNRVLNFVYPPAAGPRGRCFQGGWRFPRYQQTPSRA